MDEKNMERLCMKRGNQTVARGSRADIYIQIWVKTSSAALFGSITLFYVSSLRAYFLPHTQSGDKITFLVLKYVTVIFIQRIWRGIYENIMVKS